MKIVIKNPEEFQKIFNTDVVKAKYVAKNLAELFTRLEELGEDCVGMRISLGAASFVVVKDGDNFILLDQNSVNQN